MRLLSYFISPQLYKICILYNCQESAASEERLQENGIVLPFIFETVLFFRKNGFLDKND
jgi:hypothetical protein